MAGPLPLTGRLHSLLIQSCEEDCSQAIALDPVRVKALYKRAQCLDHRCEYGKALEDLRRVCEVEPQNKTAVALAAAVRDKIGAKNERLTPLRRVMDSLDSSVSQERAEALRGLCALVAQDRGQALALIRENGVGKVISCCNSSAAPEVERAAALRALSSCCQHEKFAAFLLEGGAACGLSVPLLTARNIEGRGEEVASPCLGFLSILTSQDDCLVQRLPQDADAEAVKEAMMTLVGELVSAWAAAVSSPLSTVRDAGMEALAHWCRERQDLTALGPSPEDRAKAYKLKEKRSWVARNKGLLAAKEVAKPLYSLLSSDEKGGSERRKAGATLSCIVQAVGGALASPADKEKDLDAVRTIFDPLLQFSPPGAPLGPGSLDPDPAASRLASAIRRVATATALANGGASFGSWAMGKDHCMAEVMTLSVTGDLAAHEAAGEAICACASFDEGRPMLAPAVENGVIFALMESASPQARSAAASGYAKLGMISQALKGDSADIVKLLNVSLDLIGSSREASEKERAAEVLSFLVSKTSVKEELGEFPLTTTNFCAALIRSLSPPPAAHGSARCKASLPRLCEAAKGAEGRSALAYGLATVFASLSISREEATKEAFKDKDVTYEQYEKLQKIAESHGQGPKPDPLDEDSPEAARRRCAKLVEAGGVQALRALAGSGASAPTLDAVARCFRNVACEEKTRGTLVAQGGLSCLVSMAGRQDGDPAMLSSARHAIAKTLVTTNPHMLTEALMLDCIPALLELLKRNDSSNLQQFEALLSLTNIASTGNAAKSCIADKKGVSTIHYLMFSDHELVRRSATEAMTNMLPHESVFKLMAGHDAARLWVAFSGIRDEDEATALAASGAVATATQDEEVAKALLEVGLIEVLEEHVASGQLPFVHRAAVSVHHLSQHPDCAKQVSQSRLPGLLEKVEKQCDAKEVADMARKAIQNIQI
jgi:hypothetical protein